MCKVAAGVRRGGAGAKPFATHMQRKVTRSESLLGIRLDDDGSSDVAAAGVPWDVFMARNCRFLAAIIYLFVDVGIQHN